MANAIYMTRRALFKAAPAIPAAFALPALAETENYRAQMIAVIERLETYEGWEASCVVAAKAFAAWQMRKAMGLEMSDPKHAQAHVDYHHEAFRQYQKSIWYERDVAEGKRFSVNLEL